MVDMRLKVDNEQFTKLQARNETKLMYSNDSEVPVFLSIQM